MKMKGLFLCVFCSLATAAQLDEVLGVEENKPHSTKNIEFGEPPPELYEFQPEDISTYSGYHSVTRNLETDDLPDPYGIDLSKLNTTDLFFERQDTKASKVVGGIEAPRHRFPFQTALYIYLKDGSNSFCGGALISRNFVLTAAHCVTNPQSVLVVLGSSDLAQREATQVRMYASRYTYHAEWNPSTIQNDISVVHLPTTITFNGVIRPVELPRYSDAQNPLANHRVVAIGWGKTSDYSDTTTRLRYLELNTIANAACSNVFGYVSQSQICTSGYGGVGTCNGDSGGPLVFENIQVGIVSYGGASCSAGYPAVFTRVTYYLNWIRVNTDAVINN